MGEMTQIRVYNPAEEEPEDYQALYKLACKLYVLTEELTAENTRLTAALVGCQEAFESGRAVGERAAEYGELGY